MSRKKFMESYGAANRNARYGWAFVNHEKKKFILVRGTSIQTEKESLIFLWTGSSTTTDVGLMRLAKLLSTLSWGGKRRIFIKNISIIWDEDNDGYRDTGSAKIKEYIEEVSEMSLEVIGNEVLCARKP